MKRLLVVVAAAAVFAVGVGIGVVISADGALPPRDAAAAAEPAVVVRLRDGELRELSAAEAAARIERLEALVARAGRGRAAVAEGPEDEDAEKDGPEKGGTVPELAPLPSREDGTAYTFEELRDLARSGSDPKLRYAAVVALRRDDSPEARAALGAVLADPAAPEKLRFLAAQGLAQPPHRDAAPEALVALLAAPDLPPDVRRELADGVTRLRERGAWMPEIAAQLGRETDPAVRKLLLDVAQRSGGDPAARAQLVRIAGDASAPLEERVLAVGALVREGGDPKVFDALAPLLAHGDAALRERALVALGRTGALGTDQLAAAVGDGNAAVRAAALAARLPRLAKNATKEERDARDALVASAARLAVADPEPEVRRAALGWTDALPAAARGEVLDAARNDRDALVRIEAYARSPAAVVREHADRVVAQLESPDARVREAAYRIVARTWQLDVPYRAGWNPKARAAAVAEIRAAIAGR